MVAVSRVAAAVKMKALLSRREAHVLSLHVNSGPRTSVINCDDPDTSIRPALAKNTHSVVSSAISDDTVDGSSVRC